MSNNPLLFDAAFSAAVGGIESGRVIRDTALAGYATVRDAASAFATTVDGLIPSSALITPPEADLLCAICTQILAGRFLLSTTDTLALSRAIVALWNECRTVLVSTAPVVVEFLNWDGQANRLQTVLPAGHIAGMYIVGAIVVVRATPGSGVTFRHTEWIGTNGAGLQTNDSPGPISLGGTGTVPTNDPPITAMSDGSGPITVEWQPGGVPLGLIADLYVSAQFLGTKG